MKSLFIIVLLFPFLVKSQDKGIQFEHNTNWEYVKEKAKTINKYIFVDCFTTWCGPCAYMSQNVFPQEKVGALMNDKFVSLKIQMDQTTKDNDDVKSWYDEAKRFISDYAVNAFPTFLIFDPNGNLVHRVVGGGEVDDFLTKVQMGLHPDSQYYTLLKKFQDNPNDAHIALNTAYASVAAYDNDLTDKALSVFIRLKGQDAFLTKKNIELFLPYVSTVKSPSFTIFKDNLELSETLLAEMHAPYTVNDILAGVLINEYIMPQIYDESTDNLDFDVLQQQIKSEYPTIDVSKYLLHSKGEYYKVKKNWAAFKDVVNEVISTQENSITPEMLNQFALTIFENCDDIVCLKAALQWSEKSLKPIEMAIYIDTYANLLYKSGDVKNAIAWQEKALNIAHEDEKEQVMDTLSKMKAGTPTWN